MKTDRIIEEWDDAADSWADFVRNHKDYFRDEMNNPAAFKLIGDVRGRQVLDLACGEGYNTRLLAHKGAKVAGIDFSPKLTGLAKEEENRHPLGIDYYVSDAARLKMFSDGHFDLVTCFMALQDIENYEAAISEVSRVLTKRGRFVFSIPHPCFEMITDKRSRISTNTRYFGEAEDCVHWNMERILKPFKTTSFHRTLTQYSASLCRNQLFMKRLVEPQPTEKAIRTFSPLKEVTLRPHSIIVESIKVQNHRNPRSAETKSQKRTNVRK